MSTNTLTVVFEETGDTIGTATFDGKKIEAEGAAAQAVAARRRRGIDDPAIWKQLAGSSNGYITFREVGQQPQQTAAVGVLHEFCRNPLHPGPCAGWKHTATDKPASATGRKPALRGLSDHQIAQRFADISRQDQLDEPALRAVIAEMDRREKPGRPRKRYAPTIDQQTFDGRLEGGTEPIGAYAASILDRRPGESVDKAVRRAHDEWLDLSYLQAEQSTRGHMLNRAGRAARVDPRTLFTGPAVRARKYASEELQRWWTEHPRLTRTEFRAQLLRRNSDLKAAAATRRQSNGRDFI